MNTEPFPSRFLLILVFIVTAIWPLNRDLEKGVQSVSDLRNRIVGARMQHDGLSPYFYKWKPEDGLRYYDPNNFGTVRVSNVTASPFFHELLMPWANLPQTKFAAGWIYCCYLLLLIMVVGFVLMAKTTWQAVAVVAVTLMMLFTEAWKVHVLAGQLYLLIPFAASLLFFIAGSATNKWWWFAFAGLLSAAILLVRPNFFIFMLPLFLLFRHYNKKLWIAFITSFIALIAIEMAPTQQRFFWEEYRKAIAIHVAFHQELDHDTAFSVHPDPMYPQWEGIDLRHQMDTIPFFSENGNFFVLVEQGVGVDVLPWHLTLLFVVSAILLSVGFFYLVKKGYADYSTDRLFFFSYGLYMWNDLLSPVYRHQYYTVQWLFPVLLAAWVVDRKWRLGTVLMLLGLVLNLTDASWIKMEHTIGEYLWLLGTFLMAIRKEEPYQLMYPKATTYA